jgi:hypothetical protein
MPTLTRLLASIMALGLLAACTAVPPTKSELELKATFLKYAGPPIDSFSYLGRYDGFRTLGDKDVVLFTTNNDAYLIHVLDPCYRLVVADRIGLTYTANTVNRNFDKVLVGRERCRIDTIRHIDYGAVKRDRIAAAGS